MPIRFNRHPSPVPRVPGTFDRRGSLAPSEGGLASGIGEDWDRQAAGDDVVSTPAILLVEDSADDVTLTRWAFAKAGITTEIVVARDGVEALDLLLPGDGRPAPCPAIVLLHLNMPRMGGLELLARLRAQTSTRLLPVIILTSSAGDADVCRRVRSRREQLHPETGLHRGVRESRSNSGDVLAHRQHHPPLTWPRMIRNISACAIPAGSYAVERGEPGLSRLAAAPLNGGAPFLPNRACTHSHHPAGGGREVRRPALGLPVPAAPSRGVPRRTLPACRHIHRAAGR
jgi:CheY-like chemotaxis protein